MNNADITKAMRGEYSPMNKAQTLVIVIFIMLILALLGTFIAELEAVYLERSWISYRHVQSEYFVDSGLERGEELENDSSGNWRPWKGCSECSPVCDSCVCPSSCTTCTYDTCKDCYLEEYFTIPPGGKKGYYDVFVEELTGGKIKLIAKGGFE